MAAAPSAHHRATGAQRGRLAAHGPALPARRPDGIPGRFSSGHSRDAGRDRGSHAVAQRHALPLGPRGRNQTDDVGRQQLAGGVANRAADRQHQGTAAARRAAPDAARSPDGQPAAGAPAPLRGDPGAGGKRQDQRTDGLAQGDDLPRLRRVLAVAVRGRQRAGALLRLSARQHCRGRSRRRTQGHAARGGPVRRGHCGTTGHLADQRARPAPARPGADDRRPAPHLGPPHPAGAAIAAGLRSAATARGAGLAYGAGAFPGAAAPAEPAGGVRHAPPALLARGVGAFPARPARQHCARRRGRLARTDGRMGGRAAAPGHRAAQAAAGQLPGDEDPRRARLCKLL
ncbi:hypothetical protein D9M72_333620 [compost metagenome]